VSRTPGVALYEVGPRDGLQNEAEILAPDVRAELVERVIGSGLRAVEVASFVDPRRVPQMAGAEEVVAAVGRVEGTVLAGLRTTVTLSVSFGCPFEGEVDPGRVGELATRVAAAAPDTLVVADTIGVASPTAVRQLVGRLTSLGPRVGGHFHNTRNTGYANTLAALDAGATVLDASVGGLGGCPFAPNATGNVATEDLVYLLEREGISTGVDLDVLLGVSRWLEGVLGRRLDGLVYRAGTFPAKLRS
jgi:isopropylmalate/homocitrate/citramalate synthase